MTENGWRDVNTKPLFLPNIRTHCIKQILIKDGWPLDGGGSFEADGRNILSLKFKTGQKYFSALLLRYFFDIQFHLVSWFCLSQN